MLITTEFTLLVVIVITSVDAAQELTVSTNVVESTYVPPRFIIVPETNTE